MSLHIVILAAGQGKRMNSALPKVLQPLGDRPLLSHVVDVAGTLEPARIHVVHGHGGEAVRSVLGHLDVNWVHQAEQLGTGHALAQAMAVIPEDARVLVLYGDVPLVHPDTLSRLVTAAGDDKLALLTVTVADPGGYGRVLRSADERVVGIVEDRDASADQKRIREINTGLLCAQARHLRAWLPQLSDANTQGEYYLTDCIGLAAGTGVTIVADQPGTVAETQGINNRLDLACAERLYQRRQAERLMAEGLMLRDPGRFDLRGSLRASRDTHIDVNVVIEGDVVLGEGVSIGPNCVLRDCRVGDRTRIEPHTMIEEATIGADCQIGPFARLRPATHVADQAKIGNFVEIKKTDLGVGSKINHLSYVGDAQVGRDVNVGAGVITCNYDGVNKHLTTIGDAAFIGSDCQLVAPVAIEAGATIGAGTTLTQNAPAGKLTVGRARQATIEGWQRPKKRRPDES